MSHAEHTDIPPRSAGAKQLPAGLISDFDGADLAGDGCITLTLTPGTIHIHRACPGRPAQPPARCRVMRSANAILALLSFFGCLSAGMAQVSAFGARFAPGSISTRDQAQAALAAARTEEEQVEKAFQASDRACYQSLLVNDCRERVRRDHEMARREIRRVEVEARDVVRRIDAEERERRKAEAPAQKSPAQKSTVPAPEPKLPAAVPDAGKPRVDRTIPPEEAARNRAQAEQREREHQAQEARRVEKDAERARSAAEQKQKQAEAAEHARKSEEERIRREARRAKRQAELEKQEAAREAIRKKAEEAARAKDGQ